MVMNDPNKESSVGTDDLTDRAGATKEGSGVELWPSLPYAAWKDTYETLHMWTQIVGKIRLARMPWLNHTWQVTLYPTATGLATGRIPYGDEAFKIDFDFVAHELNVRTSRGDRGTIQLVPMSVAQF